MIQIYECTLFLKSRRVPCARRPESQPQFLSFAVSEQPNLRAVERLAKSEGSAGVVERERTVVSALRRRRQEVQL